ncbi:hypothetical protein HKCCSP123_18985, partial [Rhodobacterales bacterium HKCCSP123]|nr:hypothetical protein [Rhodobacterales bacterium HKCCSP123]
AASARGAIASTAVAEALIRDFLGARGTALIAAQPDLTRLLGRGGPSGSVSVTRTTGDVALFTGTSGPVWAALDMQWSDIAGFHTRYSHLTFGGHATLRNDALLGVMLQLDSAASVEGVAEIAGTGWLVGPYYVGAHGGLIVDARALWGRTENEITPFGTFTDRFETERVLAMLTLSGEIEAGGATLRPLIGWSYIDDRSEAYLDALSNPVAAQRVRLTQLEAALDWTLPLGDTGTEVTGGVSGLLAREAGGNDVSEGLRGRVDLGLRRQGAGPVGFDLGLWADGLGQSGYEAYGLDLRLDWRF